MRLLLDTSVFIFLAADPMKIPSPVRAAIDDAEARILSVASAWEIAIKSGIGKLQLPVSADEWIRSRSRQMKVESLEVRIEHATQVEHLPPHHKDPFDRLLIAQAVIENLTLVTHDRHFEKYPVRLMAAWS